jgi:hypothetical protein
MTRVFEKVGFGKRQIAGVAAGLQRLIRRWTAGTRCGNNMQQRTNAFTARTFRETDEQNSGTQEGPMTRVLQ